MTRSRSRKRSRQAFESDQDAEAPPRDANGHDATPLTVPEMQPDPADPNGGWTEVSRKKKQRRKKKQKTGSSDAAADDAVVDEDGSPAPEQQQQQHQSPPPYPSFSFIKQAKQTSPVKLADLQALVLYILADGPAPQFVAVNGRKQIEKVVVLMVPGLDRQLFEPPSSPQQNGGAPDSQPQPAPTSSPDSFTPVPLDRDRLADSVKPMADMFDLLWPVKNPGDSRRATLWSAAAGMLAAPIKHAPEDKAPRGSGPQAPAYAKDWEDAPTPITAFVASVQELRADQFDLHPAQLSADDPDERAHEASRRAARKHTAADGWVDARIDALPPLPEWDGSADDLTNGMDVIALDCEMCATAEDPTALARVCLLAWDGRVLLDELVKPPAPITNYLTPYSGITAAMLDPVTTTLADIQSRLLAILTPSTILIGHSLNSDLAALKLTHPRLVDTSLLYPHPRGEPYKNGLKFLAQRYLHRSIQADAAGHDPHQDAAAALDLAKLKCRKGPAWGTADASVASIFKRVPPGAGAIVDWASPARAHGAHAALRIPCGSDADVVAGVARAAASSAFVWARLRELSALRGWWARSRHADAERARAAVCAAHGADAVDGDDAEASTSQAAADADAETGVTGAALAAAVARTTSSIAAIHASLPPRTALLLYSGPGDARAVRAYAAQYRAFRREFETTAWSDLRTHWTQEDEAGQRAAFARARDGVAFVAIT